MKTQQQEKKEKQKFVNLLFDREKVWAVGSVSSMKIGDVKEKISLSFRSKIEIVEPKIYQDDIPKFIYRPYVFFGATCPESFYDLRTKYNIYFLLLADKKIPTLSKEELLAVELGLEDLANKGITLEEVENYGFYEGNKIRVNKGNFKGFKGEILRVEGKYAKLKLEGFSVNFCVELKWLERVE